MNKFLDGLSEGLYYAETLVKVFFFAAGAFCLIELARLAARYGALIVYAMRGPASF